MSNRRRGVLGLAAEDMAVREGVSRSFGMNRLVPATERSPVFVGGRAGSLERLFGR